MFQKKIIEKYLSLLDKQELKSKYELFRSIFANKEKQENIRASKEEQYQEGFIRDLFCSCLGYTIKPEPNYNILTELKNDVANKSNSKKSDAAIILDGEVKAVIELKGCDTIDLDKVAFQAFSYKNFHKTCRYVIVSNFERLRFYVEAQSDFVEFNLFRLTETDFALLYLLLALPQIQNDIPLKLQNETQSEEKEITNNFYSAYSTFKRVLFEDLCENNPEIDKLLLFRKTQKLLDRILFILFCEDRKLLPTNSVMGIIGDYQKLKEMGYYQPLYNVFKTFFARIDKGYTNESDKSKDVFAYNGGLFKSDEILDSVKIGDDVLYIHCKRLADYDFESQISVDILGRIFENSLTEIEEIQKEIEDEKAGVKTSNSNLGKRKKDGVFYTPAYITRYIVQNTIGALCESKRKELEINDAAFSAGKKRKADALKDLDKRLETYRAWLLNLKILDPACGSGAFLIAALQELKNQHAIIDLYYSNIHQNELNFTQIENSILENNLYGVDINDDSIEIAKLSLWLNTAKPHRKLTTLNDKIKVGNSLIDDESVAGEKAFNWQIEFPEVFENGGFDVVIGNPPYVRADSAGNSKSFREYMTSCGKWQTLGGKWDLYVPFLELGIKLTKPDGLCAFIIPDAYCHAEYAKKSLDYMKSKKYLSMVDYFPETEVFQNVGVKSVIVHFNKSGTEKFIQRIHSDKQNYTEKVLDEYPEHLRIDAKQSLMGRLAASVPLSEICYISVGIVGNSDEKHFKGEFLVGDLLSESKDEIHSKLYYEGKNIGKWILNERRYIEYGTPRSPSKWRRKGFTELFEGTPKIVTMRSPGSAPRSFLDTENGYFNESAIGFKRWCDLASVENASLSKAYGSDEQRKKFEECSEKYSYQFLLAIMNSFLVRYELNSNRRSNIHIYPEDWKRLPIPLISDESLSTFISQLSALTDKMLTLHADLQKKVVRFIGRIKESYGLEKTTAALESFYNLSFADFAKELAKQKIKLTLKQKDELEDYFTDYVKEIATLNEQIAATDSEINALVYKLYGLTEDEIATIETP